MYTVCDNTKMLRLYRDLEVKLEDYKKLHEIPGLADTSLYNLGCKTATRLKNSIKGCKWLAYTSRQELPFIGPPGSRSPSRRVEYRNLAWVRVTLF